MFKEGTWDDDDNVKGYRFKSFKLNRHNVIESKGKIPQTKKTKTLNNPIKKEKRKKDKILTDDSSIEKKTKRLKKLQSEKIAIKVKEATKSASGTTLLSKLRENLKGSHFRHLNECLYKTSGSGGLSLFKDSPHEFQAYHDGYRHQVKQWPMNPLQKIIKDIKKLPQSQVITDFGCGDAVLEASVPQKVYSIDLVSVKENVIACDMANTPLKAGTVDIAVYCLSLMGVNLQDFLLEANRVLRMGGLLIIAEIASRFDSIDGFIRNVSSCGFQLERRELSHKLFVFFKFTKERNVPKGDRSVKPFSLKPCLYKKR